MTARSTPEHPAFGPLFREVDRQGMGRKELAYRSGLNLSTLSRWRENATEPRYSNLAAAWGALGYDLLPVRRKL